MPKVSLEYEQQQRDLIVQGAAQAFAELGYRQTTIDNIADKLKLSKGKIYIYFGSKEELFAAVFEEFMGRRLKAIAEAYQLQDSVVTKLEKVLDQFIIMLIQRDQVFCRLWLEFFLEGPRVPSLRNLTDNLNDLLYKLLFDLLQEGQHNGELKPHLDIASITTVLMATCDGLILNAMSGQKRSEPEAVRRAMWNTFYSLLKA